MTPTTPLAVDLETDGMLGHPLFTASLLLSIASNAVTTLMIAYTLWYVAIADAHHAHDDVISQESS